MTTEPEVIEEESEVSLRSYFEVIRRRKWIVLGTTFVVTMAALIWSLLQTPVYEGSAEVLIQQRTADSLFSENDPRVSDQVRNINTEIQIAESAPVAERTAGLLEKSVVDIPDITASAVGQTNVIRFAVRSTDPEEAASVANAAVNAYVAFRRDQVVQDLTGATDQIQKQINDLNKQLNDVNAQLAAADPDNPPPALLEQQRALVSQQTSFRQLQDQLQISAALRTGGAQIVRLAEVPESPVEPQPVRTGMLGLAVGLMLGVGIAFLVDALDDRLRSKEDIEKASGGRPVLTMVPVHRQEPDQPITYRKPRSMAAESIRSLRTSLQFLAIERPMNIVQTTSASPGEGKTTVAANLAYAFAQGGQRVVLIDADMRKPRLHQVFGLENGNGLSTVLAGRCSVLLPLQRPHEDLPLQVLPSGPIPPNPAELLGGGRFGPVLSALRELADIIIVDSPPVLPVTDAAIVSRDVDGVLLVVTEQDTHRRDLHRAVELLGQVGAPVLGTVVNRTEQIGRYGKYGKYGAYRAEEDVFGEEPDTVAPDAQAAAARQAAALAAAQAALQEAGLPAPADAAPVDDATPPTGSEEQVLAEAESGVGAPEER